MDPNSLMASMDPNALVTSMDRNSLVTSMDPNSLVIFAKPRQYITQMVTTSLHYTRRTGLIYRLIQSARLEKSAQSSKLWKSVMFNQIKRRPIPNTMTLSMLS